jgi:hypothetical protein
MLRDEIGKKNIQLRKRIQNKIKRYQRMKMKFDIKTK